MNSRKGPLQLPGEQWRPVAKYPGYEVSNLGRFRSYWSPRGLGDTPRIKSVIHNRYMKVAVHIEGGKNTLVLFAKLVAEAFIGEAHGRVIAYLDGDITNCAVSNIAYVTRKEFGVILTTRRFYQDPIHSSLGKKVTAREKQLQRLERARRVKTLRDEEKLTYREIGNLLGISESGAYRIYSGSNNHMLAKAYSQ